jgi:glycosyltransferase involved in cell wall biosynthesis
VNRGMSQAEASPTAVSVSVVIPTYRRPALLSRCLAAVLAQRLDARAFEVIVVDDGQTDDTRAAVEALAPAGGVPLVRYLRPTQGRGPAVARNAGWRAARGAVVAFTDDDTIPAADWLAEGLAALRDEQAALCGRVRVPPMSSPPSDHERMTRGLETAEFVTANAFVRRAALERVGGFDERFLRAWREDSDLQFRLMRDAGAVGRCATATVVHPVRAERWGVSLGQQRNTFYDALLYKKHPRLYRERIRRVPPWDYYAVVAATLAAPLLLFAGHAPAAGVCLALALALVLALAARRLRHTSRAPRHVSEMLVTSALIPFLSVYWRLRGAWRFRTLFL